MGIAIGIMNWTKQSGSENGNSVMLLLYVSDDAGMEPGIMRDMLVCAFVYIGGTVE